jgi:predicted P-loop ATPase
MNATAMMPLTTDDYARLAERWITPELADQARLCRVASLEAHKLFQRKKGDLNGMLIPNLDPWNSGQIRQYRERLDHPAVEQLADGTTREGHKYLQPPGGPSLAYFPAGVTVAMLEDVALPILITQGEYKAIAAWRCACWESARPRFVSLAVAGLWSWKGEEAGLIPDIARIAWRGRKVILAYDVDAKVNPKVRGARWRLTSALVDQGAVVGILEWPPENGKGIDDWLARVGPEPVLEAIRQVNFGDWHSRLIRSADGDLAACIDNAALMFEHSPDWEEVLGYNEFDGGYYVRRPPPSPVHAQPGEEITDIFDTEAVRWLERRHVMVTPSVVHAVVNLVAHRNPFHPVREYLHGLPQWDGEERLSTWLRDYCGVIHSDVCPNCFAMEAGRKFLISAVARIEQPGCKADHVLVFEGLQGIGKSEVPRILAGDKFFTDDLAELGSKDSGMQVRGVWMLELAELGQLIRADPVAAKAFFTRQTERFRPPYGRRLIRVPRQCVFVGTTNNDIWMQDETGNRRYWPVRCGQLKLEDLRRDRDQLWAEAMHAYRQGEHWWLETRDLIQEALEEQQGRLAEDPWREHISAYVNNEDYFGEKIRQDGITVWQVLRQCLDMDIDKMDQRAANRVARCLKALGWERRRSREDGEREWRYFRKS